MTDQEWLDMVTGLGVDDFDEMHQIAEEGINRTRRLLDERASADRLNESLRQDVKSLSTEVRDLRDFIKEIDNAWQGYCSNHPLTQGFEDHRVFGSIVDVLDGTCRECGEKPCNGLHGDSDSGKQPPQFKIAGDESKTAGWWYECCECGDELQQHDNDGGVHLECGQCGHEWYEGELLHKGGSPVDGRESS